MSNFCVIILAAGEGKRMKTIVPKVLCEICGKPMVQYVVEAAGKTKPKRIIVVVGRKRSQVKEVLGSGVRVAYQEKPLGTADAVKAAIKDIQPDTKDVIVLYGDTPLITEETIRVLYDFHTSRNVSCTVLTTFLDNPRGYGRILRNDAGQLVGIIEDKDANYQQKNIREINTGMYCFKKDDLLEALKHVKPAANTAEFYLTDVFSWLFSRNRKIDACVVDASEEVLGVNSQGQLLEAAEILRRRVLERFLEAGVNIADLNTTFIDASAQIGTGTKVFPFTVIDKGVCVGKDCTIGPFCHLRQGAVLKDKVSVGNFTEIKNSYLDESSRVRHVSYIGDTKIGKKVNIGAGTVVANFDGKKKNKTIIKDKAFVGCDTVLIAPVVIGKNAIVGAGSVVTRDHNVPDGALVVGVPAREIKKRKRP
jgi:bifunctional UDP-N-acetylglucosamine pyrophosphorylase/glucosamine-1-phosphate N-acetyltransferase